MYLSSCTKFVFEDREVCFDLIVGDIFDENDCLKFVCVLNIIDPFSTIAKDEVESGFNNIDGLNLKDLKKAVFTIETAGNWFNMEINIK